MDDDQCQWDDCGATFTHLPTLIDHIHKHHIGVHKSTYACHWASCPRRGLPQTSRFALISHIRSHTGEKPFICVLPECDKSFTRSDALAKHMRLQHNISPPAPGRGGSRKRKHDHTHTPAPVAHPPSSIPNATGFNTFKLTPQDHLPSPAPPTSQQDDPADPGYDSSSSDVLPAHLQPHLDPSTGLVLGRSPPMVMYLLMKAKHRYLLQQHEALLEQLRHVKQEAKHEREEKDIALDILLRRTLGTDADSLLPSPVIQDL